MIKEELKFEDAKDMLAQSKFYMGYSRWNEDNQRFENWDEAVHRVMQMHRTKYSDRMTPELNYYMDIAEQSYKEKLILGSQRALQFGGEQIFKHEARMYNCSTSYCDRPAFFNEAMYLLLCGCGVGFSVQQHHVASLPAITRRSKKKVKVFEIPDSIEGWSDAHAVLLSSYFESGAVFPEYKGYTVHFVFDKIRSKGSLISGGFKAPGPDGLRESLIKVEQLLEAQLAEEATVKLRPIVAYDIVMHMSNAVLSGGVRRSATICLFDKWDEEMLNAKTGDWFITNPQRGRSNNSAVLLRNELTREEWAGIMKRTKDFGEPGFIFSDSTEILYNPCVEVGMLPKTKEGISGWQMCNLNEQNGAKMTSKEVFFRSCEAAAALGTIQAGYTNFTYLGEASKIITEAEALIGISITGWMNSPDILFDKDTLEEGARIVVATNKKVAKLLGIKQAARTTNAKPAGNSSVILGTDSGIHGSHSAMYFRNVQMQADDQVAKILQATNPKMVENSVWGADLVVSFPVIAKKGSIFKDQLLGVKQLEYVKFAQQHWVEPGTNVELCTIPELRHNISNTISVDNWAEVEQYIYDNRQWFAGISLMAATGDKAYAQAPFTEVLTTEQIFAKYGSASMLASGLIVEGLHAFNNNLWRACDTLLGIGETLKEDDSDDLLKRDWVRRANKFAKNFFNGDLQQMTFCLKDCYNLHKWESIRINFKGVDFADEMLENTYIDADSLGAQGCSGNACEIVF